MELHLKIAGIIQISLALVHVIFPSYFNWKEELKTLSLINQQLMTVHTFFIAFMVFLMGLLCLTSSEELIFTPLGKKIILGMLSFWAIRLCVQFFGYSTKLWRGKTFETIIHIVFSFVWIYFCVVYSMSYQI